MKRMTAWLDDAEDTLNEFWRHAGNRLTLIITTAVVLCILTVLWPDGTPWARAIRQAVTPAADPYALPTGPGRVSYDRALAWWKKQGGPDPAPAPGRHFDVGSLWATDGLDNQARGGIKPWCFYECIKIAPVPDNPKYHTGTWHLMLDPWPAAVPSPKPEAPTK